MGKMKKVVLIPLLVLIASLTIAGVLSLLTDNEYHVNSGLIKPVVVETLEEFEPPEANSFEPGETVQFKKTVAAKNVGEADCYIRMAIEFSDSRTEKTSFLSSNGTTFWSVEEYKNHLPAGWFYVDDATLGGPYYYYRNVVHAENLDGNGSVVREAESTPPLFTHVRTQFTTDDFANYYNIYVYSEAVQVLNNVGEELTGNDAALNTWKSFLLNRP